MTTSSTRGDNDHRTHDQRTHDHRIHPDSPRAQPPIRWPHPGRAGVLLLGLWAVGVIVALFVPAAIVAPSAVSPDPARVWLAFSCTAIGSLVMLAAAAGLWRRMRDPGVLVIGALPAAVCVAGGLIIAAGKLA